MNETKTEPLLLNYERHSRTTASLQGHGIDALVCLLPENILLLTGFWPQNGLSAVWHTSEGEIQLLVPETEVELAKDALIRTGMSDSATVVTYPGIMAGFQFRQALGMFLEARRTNQQTIACEASGTQLAPGMLAAEFRPVDASMIALLESHLGTRPLGDASGVLNELRSIKTPYEIQHLRRVHQSAAAGVDAFHEATLPGITEVELACVVEQVATKTGILTLNAHAARAWAQVCSGAATATGWRLYCGPTKRVIEEGDMVMLELAVVVDGFWADLTRVMVAGEPDARQREVYGIVAEAQQSAIAHIRPGVSGQEVDAQARAVIARHGLESAFVHITGHGLGFRYHEPFPLLNKASTDILQVGMVVSVEPGIYLDQWGGIRLEENVLVTPDGAESLSQHEARLRNGGAMPKQAALT